MFKRFRDLAEEKFPSVKKPKASKAKEKVPA